MKNKYTLLRHAETVKDPNKHAKDWDLTSDGLFQIYEYLKQGKFAGITKIYSSTEPKAFATAKPISIFLKIPTIEMEEFVEVKREKKFLTDEEFADQKKRELTNLNSIENGDESAKTALERFISGIEKLEQENTSENILIVTHGTIMSLYLAHLKNNLPNVYKEWKKIKFCELVNI